MSGDEVRDGVSLTNLDQPLFEGAEATKRDLVDYLDAARDRIIPVLDDRPLSVVRVVRGQEPFMQKNVPRYTPAWVRRVSLWAEASQRDVSYALCNDRRTLLWFANQRAVEYHPTLFRADHWDRPTHLVLDLDPPSAEAFPLAARAAQLVRQALTDAGLVGAVKTSGAKGLHVFVPIEGQATVDVAAATRAIAARAERLDPTLATTAFMREDREGKVFIDSTRAGGATVVAVYSPRVRPKVPVAVELRPDRGRPRDPNRPGAGNARGQATRSCSPRLMPPTHRTHGVVTRAKLATAGHPHLFSRLGRTRLEHPVHPPPRGHARSRRGQAAYIVALGSTAKMPISLPSVSSQMAK